MVSSIQRHQQLNKSFGILHCEPMSPPFGLCGCFECSVGPPHASDAFEFMPLGFSGLALWRRVEESGSLALLRSRVKSFSE